MTSRYGGPSNKWTCDKCGREVSGTSLSHDCVDSNKKFGETVMPENLYRPSSLEIIDLDNGGFKIVDSDFNEYGLATVLEFNPINSDLSIKMAMEFAEYLIGYYNNNYK
jgi:hypothetical protein